MANRSLEGKVALVTGASLGIGRATALALAEAGAKVAVNYRSHPEAAEEVVGQIKAAGSQAVALQADVAELEQVERLVEQTVEAFGRLDIGVSNAAYSDRQLFHEADMKGFRRTVDVTMWGAFHLLRATSQRLIAQGEGGSIVMVSSPHSFIPVPLAMAYNMSKAAIEHMSRTAAIELAEHKIRVNTIQPGWTDTPGERKFATEQELQKGAQRIPVSRLGTPEEMARAVVFLADPASEYITGSQLLIDGGISLPWWSNRGSAVPE